jgi:histidinol-phosphate/aromatic aminotransferase/cobyric acid decarboxylase-like protein
MNPRNEMRHTWTFPYTAAKLAEGAKAKAQWHANRLGHWNAQKKIVMAEIKESGLEVIESGGGVSNYSHGMRPEVMVRNDLGKKLQEAHEKIKEHHDKVQVYEGWIQVLEAQADKLLNVTADDYLFFFGK